jgi:predicted GNAT superfamily acetyltransferase
MTALYQHPVNPQVLYQGLTGVVRSHRKRGIALALKLHGTRYAIDHGYAQIRTDNDAINAAMLGINIALGFQPRPAWIELEKLLA